MKTILLFVLITISVACCPKVSRETFIRDTTYVKVPEIIHGTGTPQIVTDTLVEYIKVKGIDTIVKFQYLPAKRIVEYVIKPDTVRFNVRDTLYNTKVEEKIIQTPFMSKIGLVLLGAVLTFLAIVLYRESKK